MKRSASPLQIAAILATWLLLSSSLSVLNVLIGLALALLLPPLNQRKTNRSNLIACCGWFRQQRFKASRKVCHSRSKACRAGRMCRTTHGLHGPGAIQC